jgi:hypothetical protein
VDYEFGAPWVTSSVTPKDSRFQISIGFETRALESGSAPSIDMAEIGLKQTETDWNLHTTAFYNTTDAFTRGGGAVCVTAPFRSRAYEVQLAGSVETMAALRLVGLSVRVYGKYLSGRHDPTEGDPRSLIAANVRPVSGRSL